jgi:zinc-ribbon domain
MSGNAGFCHRCGAQLPEGATYCPKCGSAVTGSTAFQAGGLGPTRAEMREKSEKHEKHEKNEKREKNEKGGPQGMLGPLVGGLILIWLGTTFFLEQSGYLTGVDWWAYFLSGVGVILILQGAVLYSRGHVGAGPLIGGAFALLIGISFITTNEFNITDKLWPLLLVALGVFVLVGALASRRRVPNP